MENEGNPTTTPTTTEPQGDTNPPSPSPAPDYKALYEKAMQDKAHSDKYAKDLKEKLNAKLTEDEKRAAEYAEREEHFKKLETELSKSKYREILAGGIGDEATLGTIVEKLANGETYQALELLRKNQTKREQELRKSIEQELLSKNPTPPPTQPTTKSWKELSAEDWDKLRRENPQAYTEFLKQIN